MIVKTKSQWKVNTAELKRLAKGLEQFAKEDGIQRGIFFDTSGNLRCERVSETATHSWLRKTANGIPFVWS